MSRDQDGATGVNMEVPLSTGRRRPRASPGLQMLRVRLCLLILVVDCVAIFLGCLLGNTLRFADPFAPPGLNLCVVVLPIYVGIAINSDAFATDVLADMRVGFSRAAVAYLFAVLVVLFLAFYMKANESLSRLGTGMAILSLLGKRQMTMSTKGMMMLSRPQHSRTMTR